MLESIKMEEAYGSLIGTVKDLGAVNVFIGPNNSGKTMILKAITSFQGNPYRTNFERKENSIFLSSEACYIEVGSPPGESWFVDQWERLFYDNKIALVLNTINNVYGTKIKYFTYVPTTKHLYSVIETSSKPVSVNSLGKGMLSALEIFMKAVSLHPFRFFAIDDFDVFQHPRSLPNFVRAVSLIGKNQYQQLFLSAHRLETVHAFMKVAEEEDIDIRVIQTRQHSPGTVDTYTLHSDQVATVLDQGIDMGLE